MELQVLVVDQKCLTGASTREDLVTGIREEVPMEVIHQDGEVRMEEVEDKLEVRKVHKGDRVEVLRPRLSCHHLQVIIFYIRFYNTVH